MAQALLDPAPVVRDQVALDRFCPDPGSGLRQEWAALVLAFTAGDRVGDRDDSRPQGAQSPRRQVPLRPPDFSSSPMLSTVTPRSIPLTMS